MFLPILLELIPYFLGGAVVGGVISSVVTIAVMLTIDKIKEVMIKRKCHKAMVKCIDNCHNQITLKDLEADSDFILEGTGISDDIYKGQIIYA